MQSTSPRSVRRRRLTAAAISVLAISCGSTVRLSCPACPAPGATAPVKICSADPDELRDEMAATVFAVTSDTDAPEMLFLSAGGSWGAWGAGVLYAWAEAGTRPQFEIVTGSSTGALLGVFAILADPCSGAPCLTPMDHAMKEVYTTVENDDIFKQRPILSMPFKNSINTLEPLRELITQTFTPAIVQQVGDVYTNHGRQLWAGTTDLDTGEFCNWNLSKIAAQGQYARFIDVLIASSANPGVFDPIFIEGSLHADGGVRHQLYGAWVEGAIDAYTKARQGKLPTLDHPQAFAVVNGQMAVRRQCVTNHIAPVVLRSSQILMNDALVGDLHQAKSRLDAGVPPWDMFTARIPGDYPLWPSPDQFVPANMLDLFQKGQAVGSDLSKWTAGIPAADVPATECLPLI